MSDEQTTGPTEPETTGPDVTGMFPPEPSPPEPELISLSDILNEKSIILAKEASDKATLESIGTLSMNSLKPRLVQWAMEGFRNAFPIYEISIQVPSTCSDGTSRGLAEYITFCSGKPIQDHVATLQSRLVDMTVSFCNTGYSIQIVVSRA